MKNVLLALSVLGGGVFVGWLIFGLGGRAGDMALGAVAGVCLVMVLGAAFVKKSEIHASDHLERRNG